MSDDKGWIDRLVDDMIAVIEPTSGMWPLVPQEFTLRDGRTLWAHSRHGHNRIDTPHGPYCDFTNEAWTIALSRRDVLHALVKMQLKAVMEMV